ncbi:MAG: TonB-dependent receptor [bacterium]|nr:TonB-dependent receptor [bacterium]
MRKWIDAALILLVLVTLTGGVRAEYDCAPDDDSPAEESEKSTDDEAADADGVEQAQEPIHSTRTERVVVSASPEAATVLNAPTAVDVLAADDLSSRPGDQVADQLRRVPGINIVQLGARDVNVTSRTASSTLASSTLAVTDGRSLYRDAIGFTLWEFAPTDTDLVERIEVVRGPSSSRWGPNSSGGVVNVITKSPHDTPGGHLEFEAGTQDALRVAADQSFVSGNWATRVSTSFFEMDAFERPETVTNIYGDDFDPSLGLIDGAELLTGAEQPRIDVRSDRHGDKSRWILQGGWGGTEGRINSGLGPFQLNNGTTTSYVQARWRRGLYEVDVIADHFNGDAQNLINRFELIFEETNLAATFRGRLPLAGRGVLGYGAEVKHSAYELSLAPDADERNQASAWFEADLRLTDKLWLAASGRLDHIKETIGSEFSPRISLRVKPTNSQTLRFSWGTGFRAPTLLESSLDVVNVPILTVDWAELDEMELGFKFFEFIARGICSQTEDNCGAPEGELAGYPMTISAHGLLESAAMTTSSFELGYVAQLGRFSLSTALYTSTTEDYIQFLIEETYGYGADGLPGTADDVVLPTDPDEDGIDEAPPIDTCPGDINNFVPFDTLCLTQEVPYNQALAILLDGLIPATLGYSNAPFDVDDRGVEIGLTWDGPYGISTSLNYSWQDMPQTDGVDVSERIDVFLEESDSDTDIDGDGIVGDTAEIVNIPAEHRLSLSVQLNRPQWFAGVSADYVDETFWKDVLVPDFWGYVDDYTLVGLRVGRRFPKQGLKLTAQVTNLFDEEIQQHIYGNYIERRVTVGLGWNWGVAEAP